MRTIDERKFRSPLLGDSWRIAIALSILANFSAASEITEPENDVLIPIPSVEIFSTLPSPSGAKTAYVWSPNPLMLSNYKTLVSIADSVDMDSLMAGVLCVVKYRPYVEISWVNENRLRVDCVSQLISKDAVTVVGEVSGCTIEYSVLRPIAQSGESLFSPALGYVACVIHRSWNDGKKAITDVVLRRILYRSQEYAGLKRNPIDPENDHVLIRFDGIQEIEMKWESDSCLNLAVNSSSTTPLVIYQKKENVEIELKIQNR